MGIETAFERIGVRARLRRAARGGGIMWDDSTCDYVLVPEPAPVAIDVLEDRRGEYFDIEARPEVEFEVLQIDARDRHLLLLTRVEGEKARYLCGHDERHWFVAAIPESDPVSTVRDAKRALRPEGVGDGPFVRQGEWFFVPSPDFEPGPLLPIRRNEPIVRSGGGVAHVADEAVRRGGTAVYVPTITATDTDTPADLEAWSRSFGGGVSEKRMARLRVEHPHWSWTEMLRDPELYVRGPIRHPDHATVVLRGWHRVYMNTESQAKAMAHIVFLD
jgi:hypothetical protein